MLCKMLFYLNFRQLKASESIGSRESRLNRNRNELQIKQLQVSAHITAMTCLLEHVGNVTVIIHTIHFTTNASWKLSTLIHEIVFYCILVPHAFLMNTSDNKYRILEYGWRNVIKNLLGARNKMTLKSEEENSDVKKSNGIESIPPRNNIAAQHERVSNLDTSIMPIPQDVDGKVAMSTGQPIQSLSITKPILLDPSSLLSSTKHRLMCTDPSDPSAINTEASLLDPSSRLEATNPTDTKSTVFLRFRNISFKKELYTQDIVTHLKTSNECCNENWWDKTIDATRYHEATVSELEKLGRKHTISQKILRGMVNSIEDEAMYLHYFRKLLVFIALCRNGAVLSEYELENKLQKLCHKEDDEIGDGRIEGDEKVPGITQPPPSKYTNKELIIFIRAHKLCGMQAEKIRLNGCFEYRTNARRQLLEHLERVYDTHKDYEHSLQQLIELEKGFFKNSLE